MKVWLENISKKINDTYVLKQISYEFKGGNIYGIVGKNGSGKTMLLRMVSGLIRPTEGRVRIDEKILWNDIDFPPNIGILIEKPSFIDFLTGYENLYLLAEIKGKIGKNEICEYMKLFSLDPTSKKIIKKYSLGMKQKIGIIQAIMEMPDILVLDEPFNALDVDSVKVLKNLLKELKNNDAIVIITSHHNEDLNEICDEIIQMQEGKLLL